MAVSRGKQFENVIRKSFECVEGVSIDRLNDNTAGFKGVAGICDFIVYKEPYEYYIECKSVHGNTLPLKNITEKQWQGMLEKSKIEGVFAGVICWFVDKDITLYIPIETLEFYDYRGYKSINYKQLDIWVNYEAIEIKGKKKRVFFDYDMNSFFKHFERR